MFETLRTTRLNPIPAIEIIILRIEERALDASPADVREQLVAALRAPLEQRIKESLETGHLSRVYDTLLPAYGQNLRDMVLRLPKRLSIAEQIRGASERLADHSWNGLQRAAMVRLFDPSSEILRIDYRSITTTKAVFSREQINAAAPLDRIVSESSRARMFPNEQDIAAAEKRERERATPPAGPGSLAAGCFITPSPR
jgi:hypothetical protein